MKKFLLMLVIALTAAGTASAEKVNAFSYTKSKSSTMYYARIGLSVNNFAGLGEYINDFNDYYEDTDVKATGASTAGFLFDLGFQRGIGKSGLYWGMELGIGTRGGSFKIEDDEDWMKAKATTWKVQYSPITIGYKYALTEQIKLDAHLGLFASYDIAGTDMKWEDNEGDDDKEPLDDYADTYNKYDVGMQLGVGVWYNRFNLDFTYERGFVPMLENGDYKFHSSNFLVRLGVAF